MAEKVIVKFDGVEMECTVTTDGAGEIVAEAENGRFVKFPAGTDLDEALALHNAENAAEPVMAEPEPVEEDINLLEEMEGR